MQLYQNVSRFAKQYFSKLFISNIKRLIKRCIVLKIYIDLRESGTKARRPTY